MTDQADLLERTRRWVEGDPDEASRHELERLMAAEDWDELAERMDGVLEFGTAGIRGKVEAGSNRMNRAVVIRTTAGLSDFLTAERSGPVVVGFDGRTSSRQFAEDTVGVLIAAGHDVRYFTGPVPTPMVAFMAKEIGAAAAVVVTASHNPPADNGYKVYDSNGAQIVPPVDSAIAAAIAAVGSAADVPRTVDAMTAGTAAREIPFAEALSAYRTAVEEVRTGAGDPELAIAYTPIHGVGWRMVEPLFHGAGYRRLQVVEAQRDPDGRFPTVAFPNPEEPGAMDLVTELADRIDADLVIANDPDADRLAVALPEEDGSWRQLTGNQIGILIADWLLDHWSHQARPIVINSIVSSPMLSAVAAHHGARFEQTLTGFKWIANAAMDLEAAGEGRFCCGYEEALGYSVGRVVRDKDGMSAALVFTDMSGELRAQGTSVAARLDELYRRHGLWVSTQVSVVRPGNEGLDEIDAAMVGLAAEVPRHLDGRQVVGVTDYRQDAEARPRWLAATPLVALDLDGGGRVLVRPSGTEPKLKIYVDLPATATDDLRAVEEATKEEAEAIGRAAADYLGF